MADVELVIKIPEWEYKSICEGIEASKRCGVVGIDPNIHEAIYNGTLLPQEPKTGYWIEHKHNGMSYIECSKCSTWFLRMYLTRNSFCPNCGACMKDGRTLDEFIEDSKESEDKV